MLIYDRYNDSVCSLREPTVNQLTAKPELTKMTNTKMVSSLREATVNEMTKKDHSQMEKISESGQELALAITFALSFAVPHAIL